jgi:hypothetical protein
VGRCLIMQKDQQSYCDELQHYWMHIVKKAPLLATLTLGYLQDDWTFCGHVVLALHFNTVVKRP